MISTNEQRYYTDDATHDEQNDDATQQSTRLTATDERARQTTITRLTQPGYDKRNNTEGTLS